MIAVVDYGAGNLASVRKALGAAGAAFYTPDNPESLGRASGIIVPGVGHFGAAARLAAGWADAIRASAAAGVPLLGICLGMQLLFEGSEEEPSIPGFGLLPGRCTRLESDPGRQLKVPHVGWNALERNDTPSRLLQGIGAGTQVYFTHSFGAPVTAACVASASHASRFAAAVEHQRIFGVQFHPEKSGEPGLAILRNFLGACR